VALLARVELERLRQCAIAGKEKLALVVYPPPMEWRERGAPPPIAMPPLVIVCSIWKRVSIMLGTVSESSRIPGSVRDLSASSGNS
jgi:hypothetical protein